MTPIDTDNSYAGSLAAKAVLEQWHKCGLGSKSRS